MYMEKAQRRLWESGILGIVTALFLGALMTDMFG